MTSSAPARVSIYVPCRDYGRFLREAIDSVFAQTYESWELLVVDDGSTDETPGVIANLPSDPRIATHRNEESVGLRAVANLCLREARGGFLLRLDADDQLHPRALELLMGEVQQQPDVAMVFADYFYMDENGNVTGVEALPREGGRYGPASFPPHGACALISIPLLRELGGLDESLDRQDGHEIWLRMLMARGRTAHVDIPLFYYRQHGSSLSSNQDDLLADRASIKSKLAPQPSEGNPPTVGIINVCNTSAELPDLPFVNFGSETLLQRVLNVAAESQTVPQWVVSTDCERTLEAVKRLDPSVVPVLRRPELRHHDADMRAILEEVVRRLGVSEHGSLVLIGPHSPYLKPEHVDDAVRTHQLYDVDSVVSVYEERSLTYQMGVEGLRSMNPAMQYQLRREREAVYIDNAAVRVLTVANIRAERFLGRRIGHILMSKRDSMAIRTAEDLAAARGDAAQDVEGAGL